MSFLLLILMIKGHVSLLTNRENLIRIWKFDLGENFDPNGIRTRDRLDEIDGHGLESC